MGSSLIPHCYQKCSFDFNLGTTDAAKDLLCLWVLKDNVLCVSCLTIIVAFPLNKRDEASGVDTLQWKGGISFKTRETENL